MLHFHKYIDCINNYDEAFMIINSMVNDNLATQKILNTISNNNNKLKHILNIPLDIIIPRKVLQLLSIIKINPLYSISYIEYLHTLSDSQLIQLSLVIGDHSDDQLEIEEL